MFLFFLLLFDLTHGWLRVTLKSAALAPLDSDPAVGSARRLEPSSHTPRFRPHTLRRWNGSAHSYRVAAENPIGIGLPSPAITLTTWPGQVPQQPLPPYKVALSTYYYSQATAVKVAWYSPYTYEQAITGWELIIEVGRLLSCPQPSP